VILSLWSCLFTPPRIAAPDAAQAAGTKSAATRPDIDINDLFQHWGHSGEEEPPGGTVQIFRPSASMKSPPSRFRMAYKFAPNGGCEFYVLSPDDGHHFTPCNWTIVVGDQMILQISAKGWLPGFAAGYSLKKRRTLPKTRKQRESNGNIQLSLKCLSNTDSAASSGFTKADALDPTGYLPKNR
jgi:hypothetical protein